MSIKDLFVDCLKEFLLSVQKDCDVDTSYFNVIEGHLLALKIKESLNTNKPIKV
jgi:hypothetical protein